MLLEDMATRATLHTRDSVDMLVMVIKDMDMKKAI